MKTIKLKLKEPKTMMLGFRLQKPLYDALHLLAEKHGSTVTDVVRSILQEAIETCNIKS